MNEVTLDDVQLLKRALEQQLFNMIMAIVDRTDGAAMVMIEAKTERGVYHQSGQTKVTVKVDVIL